MLFSTLATIAALSQVIAAQTSEVHGSSAQGNEMGPAAFLWPANRAWSATADNTAPCGSHSAIGDRTEFPLGSAGKVSFSIADDSTQVALRIAYGNNPTSQSDFSAFQSTIEKFEPGHQCYTVPASPASVVAGSNATIQMQYYGDDSGKTESFYACADITFIEATFFATAIPCFNVTEYEFTAAGASPSATGSTTTGGLKVAEKAGIAVAVIVSAFLIASAVFFLVRRKRTPSKDTEAVPGMTKVASFESIPARN